MSVEQEHAYIRTVAAIVANSRNASATVCFLTV